MIPQTTTRVAEHTSPEINEAIQRQIKANVQAYGSSPGAIDQRLQELENEWDIERLLEANGSTLLLVGLAMGAFCNRRWFALPALVGGFCLQHALQGWCPPIEVFRRMGVRTAREIEQERTALRALRGDFENVTKQDPDGAALSELLTKLR